MRGRSAADTIANAKVLPTCAFYHFAVPYLHQLYAFTLRVEEVRSAST
jgi:hypothetical protein